MNTILNWSEKNSMKNLHDLNRKAMIELINKYSDEVIAETFDMRELSEFDKVFFKTVAQTEQIEIILESYFELFYENKRLRRKLREKTDSKKNL